SRYKQEPVRITPIECRQVLGQECCNRDTRESVVTKRRMADMAGNQYLILNRSRQKALGVRQASIRKGGIYADLVSLILKRLALLFWKAEAPFLGVIGRTVGN